MARRSSSTSVTGAGRAAGGGSSAGGRNGRKLGAHARGDVRRAQRHLVQPGGVVDGDLETAVGERLRLRPACDLVAHEGRPFGTQLLDEQTILQLGHRAHQQFSDAARSPTLHDTL
jgi:hypothetical protein